VFVPSTLARLAAIIESGGIGPVPVLAHAVTDHLRRCRPDGDEDEWEYAAMSAAAQDSVGLLTGDDRPRRVVLAVDASSVRPLAQGGGTLVQVDEVVPAVRIVAVHVDSENAEADVVQARSAWEDAEPHSEPQASMDRCLDHELGWYAASEIGDLIGGEGLV